MQLIRKLLFPVSLLYALVVYLRNFLYGIRVFTSQKFDVPVVCIGNLSVGGTGKTPMTEFLVELLKPHYKLAVLSRGYRRKSTGFILAGESTPVEALGDEPFQIHQKFPGVPIAVNADRREGIRLLMEEVKPQLIVLDDAFQHRKVKPVFSFLLTTYGDLYTDDWYLPTGNLRDSKKAAQRADFIIVTKCPPAMNKKEQDEIVAKLKPLDHQVVLFCYLDYAEEFHSHYKKISVETLKGKSFTLVTGIANPTPLLAHLRSQGLVFEHLPFKDHHFFTKKEINFLGEKELIITTEKDYVRLRNYLSDIYYLPIRHRFMGDGKKIIFDTLEGMIKGKS